jgi:predicted Zn-dependent peptidase
MLFKGTETRSAKELKESIEGIGGSFNGFTSDEATCYMVKVPASYLELGLEVLADMVFNPKFSDEDLAKEKFVVCEEIKMYRDQPSDHVGELLGEIMWPDNPLGRPLTGTIETVKAFTREDIRKFKDSSYHPGNIAVIAAGKFEPPGLVKLVRERFCAKKGKRLSFPVPEIKQKKLNCKFLKKNINQTHVAMGFHADGSNTKDRFALKILNIVLGGNMSSRLFEELREKYGLCYDIASMYKRHSDVGEFIIHAGVDSKKAASSVIAILDELKKVRDLSVTDDELRRAKEFSKGQFLLAMESTSSRMLWLGDRLIVDGRIPDVEDLIKKIDAVTKKDISAVCDKMFRANMINLSMIGKITPAEEKRIVSELGKL